MPKSELQCYAECVYATAVDMLSNLNSGNTPLDRFISVVAWTISTVRPLWFGSAPYNPTLGETHHVSKGNLNVLLEQVLYILTVFFHSHFPLKRLIQYLIFIHTSFLLRFRITLRFLLSMQPIIRRT